jgi:hypothetical protein
MTTMQDPEQAASVLAHPVTHPIFTGSLQHAFERRPLPAHSGIDAFMNAADHQADRGALHPGHPQYFPPIR